MDIRATQFNDLRHALEHWYAHSAVGGLLIDEISSLLSAQLESVFGYHLVCLGPAADFGVTENARIGHIVQVSPQSDTCSGGRSAVVSLVIADDEELPFESDSVDVVVAIHALELNENPHQLLREIQRVLTPHGHLILVGFNPYSLFNSARRFKRRASLWHRLNPIRSGRVQDWLTLLDFAQAPAEHRTLLPFSPKGRLGSWISKINAVSWLKKLPVATIYSIHGQKMVRSHIQTQRLAKQRPSMIPIGLTTPVANHIQRATSTGRRRHVPPKLRPVK